MPWDSTSLGMSEALRRLMELPYPIWGLRKKQEAIEKEKSNDQRTNDKTK